MCRNTWSFYSCLLSFPYGDIITFSHAFLSRWSYSIWFIVSNELRFQIKRIKNSYIWISYGLFHPEGLFHIFLRSSDPRLFSKGNKQMGVNDLKAAVWCLFNKVAERLEVGAGTVHSPCLSTTPSSPGGHRAPQRSGITSLCSSPTELKWGEEHGMLYLPPSPLYCTNVP